MSLSLIIGLSSLQTPVFTSRLLVGSPSKRRMLSVPARFGPDVPSIWRVNRPRRPTIVIDAYPVHLKSAQHTAQATMNDWIEAEQHIERARELFEARRWAEAEVELRSALDLNPSRADWRFNLGLTLEAAGRFEAAVEAYREALSLEPASFHTSTALGVCQLRIDDVEDAVTSLNLAHQLDPDRPEPLVALIDAHARLEQHEQAELCFYMALQLDDADEAQARLNLSGSLLDRGLNEQTIVCLREAVKLDPMLPQIHARLAEACAAIGRKDRARQLYLRELRTNPGDVETLLDLGCLLMEMNRPAEAGEKFRRVLEVQHHNADAHYYLAELALESRRHREAIGLLRLAVRLDPAHFPARRLLIEAHLSRDEREVACKLLRRELDRLARHPSSFVTDDLRELGALLIDADMSAQAVRVLGDIAADQPDDAALQHHYAVACFQAGDRRAGVAASKRALKLAPDLLAAMHNLAVASLEEGRWRRAMCWVRRGLGVSPDDAALLLMRKRLRRRAFRASIVQAAFPWRRPVTSAGRERREA